MEISDRIGALAEAEACVIEAIEHGLLNEETS